MPRKSSSNQKKSISRVKDSVRRFFDNMAGERFEETDEDTTEPEERASQVEEIEDQDLPEDFAAVAREEAALKAAEHAQLEAWRAELSKTLSDREERVQYFADLANERTTRFATMLENARAQIEGRPIENDPLHAEAPIEEEAAPAAPTQPIISVAYTAPTIELLEQAEIDPSDVISSDLLDSQELKLQKTLDNFAVDAHVYDAIVGPRVTQFRVKPGMGVRVESIQNLQKNISLNLAQSNIRIQAPIPGEPFVGVEVGNGNTLPIRLRSVFESRAWQQGREIIPIAMGMDIQGKIIVADLAKAPHLLIAGATGSGKSVCMSNLILSLLYRFAPEELELVLIDPKRVEFGLFRQVPHLIHPVVGDPEDAVRLLKWVVKEMENRYETLAGKQVRNIAGYNAKAEATGEFDKMPFMVVIIDELADLMMTSKGEAEASLARIAQLSRAVGIHTIIATQRPSVNVITGVIKANYPTRVAFQVSSHIDSRTILDCKGAESLLGQGDMLFNPPGIARLLRIQSPLVQDEEIVRVVTNISEDQTNRHRVDLSEFKREGDGDRNPLDEGVDDLFLEALTIVAESQKASTSYLQRRLRIGYNRAATLIEEMEDRFYIGPQNGSTPREIFISPEELAR